VAGVHGRAVTESNSAEGLADVQIVLVDDRNSQVVYVASTDSAGRFKLPGVPPGSYTLKTCKSGFNTLEYHVTVSRSGSAEALVLVIPLSA
jgi:hypothetical protein